MSTILVKSHRRGKSVVKSYLKAGNAARAVDKRIYGDKAISKTRRTQLRILSTKLQQRTSQLRSVLDGKLRVGAAILGGKNFQSTRRYFSNASMNKRLNRTQLF